MATVRAVCSEYGCPAPAAKGGRCTGHARTQQQRPGYTPRSSTALGYDRQWRKIRASYLKANPYCIVPGCMRLATHVDHITPKNMGGSNDVTNLQAMCLPHHSQKTARSDGGYGNATR